jgi:TRAP-type C4-dicarboxylate transport system permease small subunit
MRDYRALRASQPCRTRGTSLWFTGFSPTCPPTVPPLPQRLTPAAQGRPTLTDRCCRVLEWIIAGCLAAMAAMVFGNVVLRYVFNSGIAISEEVSRWLFVWLTFLGAIVALREHAHLGTDVLLARLPRAGKRACMAASQALMLGVTLLLLQGSLAQARINRDVEAPITGVSMAVVYLAGVAFAVPAALLLLAQLWRTLGGRLRDDELVLTRDSEELP